MLTIHGKPRYLCNGLSRRDLLHAGGAGLLGTNLTSLFAAEDAGSVVMPRAKSVMFLFLFGGPSMLETFDMKPDAALGISSEDRVHDALSRPVSVMDGGQPLMELFG